MPLGLEAWEADRVVDALCVKLAVDVRVDDADAFCVWDAVTTWLRVIVEDTVWLAVVVTVPVPVADDVGTGEPDCDWVVDLV